MSKTLSAVLIKKIKKLSKDLLMEYFLKKSVLLLSVKIYIIYKMYYENLQPAIFKCTNLVIA